MERIREQMEIADEINIAISQPLGSTMFDEDELNAELEELEQEELDKQLLDIRAPSVPVGAKVAPVAATTKAAAVPVVDEDAELRALEESMAI